MATSKTKYVDGFLLVVPKKNIAAYKKMAEEGARIWMKHGALDYKECVADDIRPQGVLLSFPKLVNLKPSETVVFSYITFKSRAHRDRVNANVMKDPAMSPENFKDKSMPFDMNRMSYGGFEVIVSA